ncbi:MAG: hypothetical protein WC080_02655 [Patescibacteria group bacterium]|jgi:hypothetical protein
MKKVLVLGALFATFCLPFLIVNQVSAMETVSSVDATKITLTYNKTTAVADGSDTINFWYGAYYTQKTPFEIDCSDGASPQTPLPATVDTDDGQLCRAAAYSNKMTLSISGSGNNVSPNPLGGSGGILPDYNLISGTGEFTLKSSTPGEKIVTYTASSLLPGAPSLTLSVTVNFTENIANGGDTTGSSGSSGTGSQAAPSGSGQSANSASGTSQNNGAASTAATTATDDSSQTGVETTTANVGNNSASENPYLIYYIAGAVLLILIALFLYWLLYLRKKSGIGAFGMIAASLMLIFIAVSAWLFILNRNLTNDKKNAENNLVMAQADLEKSLASKDEKMTGVANKLEAMSLIFGEHNREKNNFDRAGALITAMGDETLNADWAAMQANRGQTTGEKLISDLITAASESLK